MAAADAAAARAEATREHARIIQLEERLIEMDQRLARQARACKAARDPASVEVASARPQPKADPHRSQGDFLTEAHAVAPPPVPAAPVALASSQPATAASERERLEQLLQGLREYGFDPQSGLSIERREALRVLLRRERQLDLMNPWDGH